MRAVLTGTVSVRVAWRQRGWNAGRFGRPCDPPQDEEAKVLYLAGYVQGERARANAQRVEG